VNIARALSVSDGKGDVNASARAGKDLTFCRGNCAAWLSGPEKSRQTKQMSAAGTKGEIECDGAKIGFVAWKADISGLEDRGMGGASKLFGWLRDETRTGGFSVYAPVFPSSMMDFETAGEVVAKEPEVYLLTIGWKPDF
jgi:hypothetical protein